MYTYDNYDLTNVSAGTAKGKYVSTYIFVHFWYMDLHIRIYACMYACKVKYIQYINIHV
jgi:hypothetical protein